MPQNSPHPTILLLSSDASVRSAVQEILERGGYVVLPARDLGSAVSRLDEATPQLLIVSSYTDNISGHAAAVYLRTRCHGLPVLLLNGIPDDGRLRYREKVRSFEIFPKPFEGSDLLAKVKETLSRQTEQQEVDGRK
jgi:DNA-binding response OmpR family regulator